MWWSIVALHVVAACFSSGYLHPDEHFQILEIAWHRSGLGSSVQGLPWEMSAEIRAGLSPWLASQMMLFFSEAAPSTIAFLLRLLSTLLGSGTLYLLWRAFRPQDHGPRNSSRYFFILTWFLPLLQSHFSSESLSGSFFFASLSLVLLYEPRFIGSSLVSGLLSGLAFQFRYQAGFLVAGLGAWLWFRRQPGWRFLAAWAAGLLASFALGACADYWLYGHWTLPAWHFFRVNLIEGKAAQFGTSPWWEYFRLLALQLTVPPWSIAAIVISGAGLLTRAGQPLLWSILPFFVVQCAIGHKELRFLYPLAPAFPVMMTLGLDRVKGLGRLCTGRLFWITNAVLLAVFALKPARFSVSAYEWLWHRAKREPLCLGSKPSEAWVEADLPIEFYRSRAIQVNYLPHPEAGPRRAGCRNLIWSQQVRACDEPTPAGWRSVYRSVPCQLTWLNAKGLLDRVRAIEILEFHRSGEE